MKNELWKEFFNQYHSLVEDIVREVEYDDEEEVIVEASKKILQDIFVSEIDIKKSILAPYILEKQLKLMVEDYQKEMNMPSKTLQSFITHFYPSKSRREQIMDLLEQIENNDNKAIGETADKIMEICIKENEEKSNG